MGLKRLIFLCFFALLVSSCQKASFCDIDERVQLSVDEEYQFSICAPDRYDYFIFTVDDGPVTQFERMFQISTNPEHYTIENDWELFQGSAISGCQSARTIVFHEPGEYTVELQAWKLDQGYSCDESYVETSARVQTEMVEVVVE